jgi:O-antigen ligase
MSPGSSAAAQRTTVRHIAVAAVLGTAFVFIPLAPYMYQPVRAVVVAVALLLMLLFAAPEQSARLPRIAAAVLAVLVVWLVVAALANEPASSVWGFHGRYQALVSFGIMLIAGIAGWYGLREDMRWIARATAVATTVMALVVAYQVVFGANPIGTLGNRVMLGSWLAVTTAGALAAWRAERGRVRWLLLAAAGLGALGMGLAGSRGAWIGLLAAVLLIVVAGGWRRSWPLMLIAGLVVVGALLLGGESGAKLSPSSLTTGSAAARWEIWRGASAMIADNPLVGVGPGRFFHEYPAYQTQDHAVIEAPDPRPDQAHSLLLHTASEAGLPAALAILALIGLALWGAYRALRGRDPAALAASAMFVAFLGQGLFGIATIETNVLGWLVGGVLIGYTVADGPAVSRRAIVAAGAGVAAVLALASAYYVAGDVRYRSGLRAFDQGDIPATLAAYDSAISMNPLMGTYRTAYAQAATVVRGETILRAEELLAAGLELEPGSHDLALARARVLALTGASPDDVADAYLEAVEAFPLGVDVRVRAAVALAGAGRTDEARAMAEGVLELAPDNPLALSIVEGVTDE